MWKRIGPGAAVLLLTCATPPLRPPPGPVTEGEAITAPASAATQPPLFPGLGAHRRVASHTSAQSQLWFDQGLNLAFGLNRGEAVRSFAWAAALSPDCAICFWGIAWADGPANPGAAFGALQLALTRAEKATPVEQALIAALGKRYAADPQPANRAPLELAYAEAMRGVRAEFPGDADVAALTAEALMELGSPSAWTPETLEVIGAALSLEPEHPLANQLLIRAVEGSAEPARASAAAELLRTLQPGLAQMVHLPSHIDVRTGEWDQAIDASRRAIEADAKFQALVPGQPAHSLSRAHHQHMLAWAAMMSGRSAEALQAVTKMVDEIPPSVRAGSPERVDALFAVPLEVQMRFGKWDEILAVPELDEDLPASRALRHAARGFAFASRGDLVEARREQQLFEDGRARVPAHYRLGQNPVSAIHEVAAHLLAGELLYRDHRVEAGFAELRLAVEAEDRLRYDGPPDWLQSTRHALGAALTRSRRYAEAEAVFREDLRRTPKNGWALFGLARVLRLRGQPAEAQRLEQQFQQVWSKADLQLEPDRL